MITDYDKWPFYQGKIEKLISLGLEKFTMISATKIPQIHELERKKEISEQRILECCQQSPSNSHNNHLYILHLHQYPHGCSGKTYVYVYLTNSWFIKVVQEFYHISINLFKPHFFIILWRSHFSIVRLPKSIIVNFQLGRKMLLYVGGEIVLVEIHWN